jgi:pimeloyl-ACP methyl ester carboxylesterase
MKKSISGNTVVFLHGIFTNPKSWGNWTAYFQSRGFACHAPAYPFHEGDPARLRAEVDPSLTGLTLTDTAHALASFIDALPEKPILIGRSFGGLIAQKLLEMEKAAATIAIDSTPPKGIFAFKWSFLRSSLPIVNPFKGSSVCLPSVKWFKYACCNGMTLDEARVLYEKLVVPESRNLARGALEKSARIDFGKPHNPLLIIAGGKDHIIPAILSRKNFLAYTDHTSTTDFKLFPDRTHMLTVEDGWEEIADYVISWIDHNRVSSPSPL